MARRLRYIPEGGALVEVCTRTFQGRFFLRPIAEVNEIILGVLGRAQRKYGVAIHDFVFLSNHYHMLITVRDTRQQARFIAYVNANIAKEVMRIVGWRGKFWATRYHSTVVHLDEVTPVSRLRYLLSNGCKEGLVASPLKWGGVSAARALFQGSETLVGTWFDRTAEYRARQRGDNRRIRSTEIVRLTPLPTFQHLSKQQQQLRIAALVRDIEEETLRMHRKRKSRPIGMAAVKRRDPLDQPTDFEPSPAPLFHATSRASRQKLRDAFDAFVCSYREAAAQLRAGGLDARFPPGSFPPPRPFVSFAPG